MFASLGRALAVFFDPALYGVLLRAFLITVALFVALLAGTEYLLHHLPALGSPAVNRILEILTPVLMVMGLIAMGGPVAAIFASLYLDRIAAAIEARAYAADPRAPGMSMGTGIVAGIRLAGLVLVADLLLLPADALLPGLAQGATILVNGFLLGREYFELAALRHVSRRTADALRSRNGARIFGAGLIISVMASVPLAGFFAPMFGAALMVHLYKRIEKETPA